MSINNCSKNVLCHLFEPLVLTELKNEELLQKIKSDSVCYSKLKLLSQQIEIIKKQIHETVSEGLINTNLHKVECRFKKVCGNTYHLYKKNDNYFFSQLSLSDWNYNPPYQFIASYLYDFDHSYKHLNGLSIN